ncbi:hypothetical protein SAMN05421751_12024 [Jhaorihella thermophila]|uniref:Ferric reductase like transmembrane component n=2 Tax=Jhaorihella thermophila TaxID=488547 RepID=A0A1H5YMP6_9RHOB|nr:hypothetical protein SAMN05421751_12024 [Jhaorihella thermophila]
MTATRKRRRGGPARGGAGAWELAVILAIVVAVLDYAWTRRDEGDLTAETGLGYYLGIVGGVMMLMLLLYPMRKRFAALRFLGGIRGWFRVHMILGIVGPALMVLHSNFTLASLNGSIAFPSMSIVAISGLVGRFLYTRIHRGLYGRRASTRDYLGDSESFKAAFRLDDELAPAVMARNKAHEERRLTPAGSLWTGLGLVLSSPWARFRCRRDLRRPLRGRLQRADRRALDRTLNRYLFAVARAEAFAYYEQLFALWHLLHFPLFILLVLAALIHVVAVHLY